MNCVLINKRKPIIGMGWKKFISMYGIDKYGKRVEITGRSSLVGRSFQSITIECVDDLKILPKVQSRLMWRYVLKKQPSSAIVEIKSLSAESLKKEFFSKHRDFFRNLFKK